MSNEKKLTCPVLVKDSSVTCIFDSELYTFLKAHDFKLWALKDYPVCNWIYISLTDKTYMPGIPGISVAQALGAHAITVNEFFLLYQVYEQYSGMSPLAVPDAGPYPLMAAVRLASNTMNIRLALFDRGEVEEDGDKIYQYRLAIKSHSLPQCVNISIEDTISSYGIKLLCNALADGSLETEAPIVYSWGRIEFSFRGASDSLKMMLFAYLESAPDEDDADDPLSHNCLYMELEAGEVEKFRDFLATLVRNKNIDACNG